MGAWRGGGRKGWCILWMERMGWAVGSGEGESGGVGERFKGDTGEETAGEREGGGESVC